MQTVKSKTKKSKTEKSKTEKSQTEKSQSKKNACIKGTFVFRPLEKRKSIIDFRFSILENNLENKISIYFTFIKRPIVFRAHDKWKTDFETNFVFHFQKKVTLAQTSFGTLLSVVGNGRSTPPRFFPYKH